MKLMHPLAKLVMLSAAAVVTMFARSLTAACISAFFALAMLFFYSGRKKFFKALGALLIFTAFMALTNPLFAHEGRTALLYIKNRVYTLEAMLYGAGTGLSLGAVIIWLGLLNTLLPKREQLYLFGRLSPKLALIVSMTLGYIPRMREKLTRLNNAQKTSGIYSDTSTRAQFRAHATVFSALAAWSVEASVDTAQAMDARCYGSHRAQSSMTRKFRPRDFLTILACIFLAVCAFGSYSTGERSRYYPKLKFGSNEAVFAAVFGLLAAMPVMITIKERLKWRLFTAKNSASPTTAAKDLRSAR